MVRSAPAIKNPRPLWLRVVLGLAAIGFAAGIYLSYRAQPDLLADVRWGPVLVVAAVGVPLIIVLNMLEFQRAARLLGQEFGLRQAAEITIIGSVANMLPIPGGTMVRVAALKRGGASVGQGTAATLLVSGLWIGVAFVYSGLWVFWLEVTAFHLGAVFVAVGVAALAVCLVLGLRLSRNGRLMAGLLGIKIAIVAIDAACLFLCLLAFGVAATFAQASVLGVSSVMGAAVSIVPAGLGIREAFAALLAPVVALSAAAAFLAAGLNRLVGLAVMAPLALYLGLSRGR